MKVLFENNVQSAITPLTAAVLLVFSLLYTPCVAAVASVRREMGGKWAAGMVIWQCLVAWVAALVVRAVCIVMGMG
jgi:ferrous iron transport protein B